MLDWVVDWRVRALLFAMRVPERGILLRRLGRIALRVWDEDERLRDGCLGDVCGGACESY